MELSARLEAGEVPDRIARLRVYHFVEAGEDQVTEMTDLTPGAVSELPGGIKLTWGELVSTRGGKDLKFTVDFPPEARSTVETILERRVRLLDAAGKPIKRTGWGGGGREVRVSLPPDAAPVKAAITIPRGLQMYGGLIEFRDVPVPKLPDLPQ
jgi:hypothetical protein